MNEDQEERLSSSARLLRRAASFKMTVPELERTVAQSSCRYSGPQDSCIRTQDPQSVRYGELSGKLHLTTVISAVIYPSLHVCQVKIWITNLFD